MIRISLALAATLALAACGEKTETPAAEEVVEAAPDEIQFTSDTAAAVREAVADTEAAAREAGPHSAPPAPRPAPAGASEPVEDIEEEAQP